MSLTTLEGVAAGRPVPHGRPRFRYAPVLLAAVLVGALSVLPLAFVLYVAVQAGWETAWALIVRPRVGELLVNTALLELFTLPIAVVLGVGMAWLIERTDLPGAGLWSWLAVAPLAIPAFVHSYAWNTALPTLHGLPAAVLVSVLAYTPFLYLPVTAQLRSLDPALEDAAAALGLPPLRRFARVVLPQLRLSICGGALLIGLHLLGEYGLYAMIRFDTFTTAIVDQYQSAFNGPLASMLAVVLVLCCFGLLQLEAVLRGDRRYARLGAGAARQPTVHALGHLRAPALLVPAIFALLALGVPAIVLTRWLMAGGAAAWTPDLLQTLLQTCVLALCGGVLTSLAAAPMAWLSVRAPGRLQRVLEAGHYYVGALPGVVVALALVTISVRIALPLYQTAATLLLAYVLLFLPRALTALRPSVAQVPIELEQAAVALGRTPVQALRQITLRLAAPGAAASACLVALAIMTELTATLMLAPNGTRTLAMAFWSFTAEIDYPAAAPYAVMMILASLPVTALLRAHFRAPAPTVKRRP